MADEVERCEGQPLKVSDVREQADKLEQDVGGEYAGRPRNYSHCRQKQQARAGGEIAQFIFAVGGPRRIHSYYQPKYKAETGDTVASILMS